MLEYTRSLQEKLDLFSLHFKEEVLEDILNFMVFLFETNKQTNLTSITNWEEAIIKHIIDSFLIIKTDYWLESKNIIDVGSGPGFPGIPLLFTNRDKKIYLVESNHKKVSFLKETKKRFSLDNLHILCDRAETVAGKKEFREGFDLVLARALASLPSLLELTLPFCRTGGIFCAYKGPDYKQELKTAKTALLTLGAEFRTNYSFVLPNNQGKRSLLIFQKTKRTPDQYPRRPGIPTKRPLI